jgi:trehalose/maltose transport system substrate-binding protein
MAFERWIPSLSDERRQEVQEELDHACEIGFVYHLLTILSVSITTFGLILDSAPIVTGGNIISPVMLPILGISLASVSGNSSMFRRAIIAVTEGAVLSIILAVALALLSEVLPFSMLLGVPGEVRALTHPTPFDLIVALAAGAAGAYAIADPHVSTALPGVAVATALNPPLCAVGVGIALEQTPIWSGALLLLVTNVVAILFAGILVFALVGFRPWHLKTGGREYIVSGALVLLVAIPLFVIGTRFAQEASEVRAVNEAVRFVLRSLPEAELVEIESSEEFDTLHLEVTVRTADEPSHDEVIGLQDWLADRLQRRVVLNLVVVPMVEFNALLPPTVTPTGRDDRTLGQLPAGTPVGAVAQPTALAEEVGTPVPTTGPEEALYTRENPPAVEHAAAARQFSVREITYSGDTTGIGRDLDRILVRKFTEDTGIKVRILPKPENATEAFETYQGLFQNKSSDIDVMMLDVIWPGAFAPHLVDLTPALGELAQQHYSAIIENNTVEGRLVAMPWFGDFGMLYYRTDLLQKYGFKAPPQTWDELEQMAQTIMAGEQRENPNFMGFVFQGAAYEGLTCDALEWVASVGGGTFIKENGEVTINNPEAIQMLNRTQRWVGTIAPRGVTSFKEEESRIVFQGGNAAFMRNWPYVYALAQQAGSPIKGKFDVAPLPTNAGQQPVGTVGGWQLAVSRYSDAQEAAIEFVRYMTSPEVQTYRALVGAYVPTIPSVAQQPAVLEALPFLQPMENVKRVTRPSGILADKYNEGSTAIFQGVNQILNGADAAPVLRPIEQKLQRLVRR